LCKKRKRKEAFLPLEFDAGQDAQVDWGEARIRLAGQEIKAHFLSIRVFPKSK
jgi:transposase